MVEVQAAQAAAVQVQVLVAAVQAVVQKAAVSVRLPGHLGSLAADQAVVARAVQAKYVAKQQKQEPQAQQEVRLLVLLVAACQAHVAQVRAAERMCNKQHAPQVAEKLLAPQKQLVQLKVAHVHRANKALVAKQV